MPKIDVARLNALRPKTQTFRKPTRHRQDTFRWWRRFDGSRYGSYGKNPKEKKVKSGEASEEGANDKEKESFRKRVFRIPLDKPFEEAYYTYRLWMFFKETREKEEDTKRMFCEARENMRKRVTSKKKSDPGQFAIPCTVKGIEFPHALCDTEASVNILPRVMAAIWVCRWSLPTNCSLLWNVLRGNQEGLLET